MNIYPDNAIQYAIMTEFDGSAFHGWQRQVNAPSVQGCLESAWRELTGESVALIGGSRTDAGVSASGHVAAFHSATSIPVDRIARAWNTKLPESVAVRAVRKVSRLFNPRYDALGKHYRYTILTGDTRPVLRRRTTAFIPGELDVDAMRSAIPFLRGTHNFSSFMDQGSPTKRFGRTLHEITIEGETELVIAMKGDGFLYHMARIIAGTLVYIGQGKIAPDELPSVFAASDRTLAGPTMPAEGLLLERVYFAADLFGGDRWPYEDERREAKLRTLLPGEPSCSPRAEQTDGTIT